MFKFEKMADKSAVIVSAVGSYIQLLTDLNEMCFDAYGGDTDDEDNVVTIAAKTDLLCSQSDDEQNEPTDFRLLSSQSSALCSKTKAKKLESDDYSIGYAEITVGLYTDLEFRQQFHMSRRTVEVLCRKLIPLMLNAMAPRDNPIRSGRPSIRLEKKILVTLWYLSNQQTFRMVAERFEISTSTVEDSLRRTVSALVEMAGEYIYWPVGEYGKNIQNYFHKLTRLQGILGILGTARFRIKTVKETPKIYADSRLGGNTITVQFVCDNDLRFIDCYAGLPGGSSDATILRNSDLYSRTSIDHSTWFPDNSFAIGGLSLPLEPWLMTPFVNIGHLSNCKNQFNAAINVALNKMYEAMALLKGRFQRLNMLESGRLDYLPVCVSAAFVLHNFCLIEESNEVNHLQEYISLGIDSVMEDYGLLTNHQFGEIEIDEVSDPDRWIQGCEIRNNLCNTFNADKCQL